jgi:hypothetical protein
MLISTLFSYFSLHRILHSIIPNHGSYYPKLFRVTRVYVKLIDFDILNVKLIDFDILNRLLESPLVAHLVLADKRLLFAT